MKKSFLLFVAIAGLSLTFNQPLLAQESQDVKKLFYAELSGPGMIMSANFDSRFNPNTVLGLGYRLGAGFAIKTDSEPERITKTYYSFPVGLNYLFGQPHSNFIFEVGAGVSFLTRKVSLYTYSGNEKQGRMVGFASFMYRYMPVDGGFSFRVGFTPIIGTAGDLFPMAAIGFGYAF